jgi:hypothetical protein
MPTNSPLDWADLSGLDEVVAVHALGEKLWIASSIVRAGPFSA